MVMHTNYSHLGSTIDTAKSELCVNCVSGHRMEMSRWSATSVVVTICHHPKAPFHDNEDTRAQYTFPFPYD